MKSIRNQIAMIALCSVSSSGFAADSISVKQISMELARDIAQKAIEACRTQGFQVSAVVVDRSGSPQAILRDTLAPRFTMEIAEKKANAVVLSGVASSVFRKNRSDIRMEMDHVTGIAMMDGGLPIRSAGHFLGAVGVSGAPGGDKDEACAAKALDELTERLEFAD